MAIEIKRVVALGFFDGVHLGHRGLLHVCRRIGADIGAVSSAMTFDCHPLETIEGHAPKLIMPDTDKRASAIVRWGGIDEVIILDFDKATADMEYGDFIDEVLIKKYGTCHIVAGESFTCGRGGEGTAEKIREYALMRGIGCEIVPDIAVDGDVVSSTRIRKLIEENRTDDAVKLLGHNL